MLKYIHPCYGVTTDAEKWPRVWSFRWNLWYRMRAILQRFSNTELDGR